jgi:hypothetical protein
VILSQLEGEEGSDYINANHIDVGVGGVPYFSCLVLYSTGAVRSLFMSDCNPATIIKTL